MLLNASFIRNHLPDEFETLWVAYSGGLDSHVLLHLCANDAVLHEKIVAVHVHHGLQSQADSWVTHCRSVCAQLSVSFRCLYVDAKPGRRQSPEEAAREARYQAFNQLLKSGDVLLLGQHRDDQMETMLLQLLRGAGLAGLAAMPEKMPLAAGVAIRPLLDVGKEDLNEYAVCHQLRWIEDPTNCSLEFDRNFLRNRVVPVLRQRWPAMDKSITRSARHCAAADRVLTDWVDQLLDACCNSADRALSLPELLNLNVDKQHLLLRRWLAMTGVRPPSEKVLQSIVNNVVMARQDADPVVKFQGRQIRRFKQTLYCMTDNRLHPEQRQIWPGDQSSIQRKDGSELRIVPSETGILTSLWGLARVEIRLRQGGEKLRLPGNKKHSTLKKLLQQSEVPPWQRVSIPLIYLDGKLAAVADLWVHADYYAEGGEPCYRIEWVQKY